MAPGCMDSTLRWIHVAMFGMNTVMASLVMKLVLLLPLDEKTRREISLFLCKMAWGGAFLFSPWVQFSIDSDSTATLKKVEEELVQSGRSLFVMSNHTSYADAMLWAAYAPFSLVRRCRAYANAPLFKAPVLGTICHGVGHFPVHFTSSSEGKFKVDEEKMKVTDALVSEHVNAGGGICYFPEGQINKDPDKIQSFRWGGVKKALEFDAHVMFVVFLGNQTICPKGSSMAGFPGKVRFSAKDVSPMGLKAFLADLRKSDLSAEEKEMPDAQLLSLKLQELMQKQYNEQKEAIASAGREKSS